MVVVMSEGSKHLFEIPKVTKSYVQRFKTFKEIEVFSHWLI
jgi:hypothetical protein